MNKKLSAYSSVLLIVIIFLLALGVIFVSIVTNQNILEKKVNKDDIQGKYIAESYLNMYLSELRDEDVLNEGTISLSQNIFPDLDHDKSCQIFPEEDYFGQPSNKILVNSSHKKLKSSAEAYVSKYNKIFFLKDKIIREETLENKNKKYLEIFREKINQGILFSENAEVFTLNSDDVIYRDGKAFFIGQRNEEDGEIGGLSPINNLGAFVIKDKVEISSSHGKEVILRGAMYLEGSIILDSDFTFAGIIISNGGKIYSGKHEFVLMGKVIELSSGGSFSNLDGEELNLVDLETYLDLIEAAKLREVINIKINNSIK